MVKTHPVNPIIEGNDKSISAAIITNVKPNAIIAAKGMVDINDAYIGKERNVLGDPITNRTHKPTNIENIVTSSLTVLSFLKTFTINPPLNLSKKKDYISNTVAGVFL
jgi:hypothetical protein